MNITGRVAARVVLILLLGTLAGQSMVASSPAVAQESSDSLEQQLAEKYAPIVMIKAQDAPCDNTGRLRQSTSCSITPMLCFARSATATRSSRSLLAPQISSDLAKASTSTTRVGPSPLGAYMKPTMTGTPIRVLVIVRHSRMPT